MADVGTKKIWIRLKRLDIGKESNSELYCIDIHEKQSGQKIKETMLQTCDLCNLCNIVLKLRNHRGSLIPITWNLSANSSARPYLLEVVKVHQNIKPQPRSVKIKSYNETTKEKLNDITRRFFVRARKKKTKANSSKIDTLETAVPELKEKRNERINREMQEVEQMLEFVAKRLNDAENVNWKGMFKKNPLW